VITGVESEWYGGLDLGQKRDYSALALLERARIWTDERDPVTYAWRTRTRYALRYVERIPLGTDYVEVARRVCGVAGRREIAPLRLAVDATGVGLAVVDLLRRSGDAGFRSGLAPVVITGGSRARYERESYYVPRKDLLDLPVVMLERRQLVFAADLPGRRELEGELRGMGVSSAGAGAGAVHDDLVMALALAVWRARVHAGGVAPVPGDSWRTG
jgi:hypothetical protein